MSGHRPVARPDHVLVVLDGAPSTRPELDAAWPGWCDGVDWVVAVDGGARLASALGFAIDRWVGDGDSISAEHLAALRQSGIPVDLRPTEKDETDGEVGVLEALATSAGRVTIVGGLGGARLDHELANVMLPALGGSVGQIVVLDGRTRIRHLRGDTMPARMAVDGRPGDLVTLIPISDCEGVTTQGLRFPLRDEPLLVGHGRGVSNVRETDDAWVELRSGRLLVVEVPATLAR